MAKPRRIPFGLRARLIGLGLLGLLGLLAGCAATPPTAPSATVSTVSTVSALPEGASGWNHKTGISARRQMVATANPLASDAGLHILRAGGSALDAAIAAQMVLSLVEPQSSGIGGGAFLMLWDGKQVQAWDGRETAPALADERMFLDAQGKPLPLSQAVQGGRAVATPGVVRMLEAAHRQQGRLPWADLFEPAIALAEQGFAMSPRLHQQLQGETLLRQDALARAYFYAADGEAQPVGQVMRNPALAAVLRGIANQGSVALHEHAVAADMVRRVRTNAVPGQLSLADLKAYAPKLREPICTDWQAQYRVCGFPPPSFGRGR